MLSQSTKTNIIVLAFPLMVTFLAEDCTHQKRNVNGQSSETNIKMGSAQTGLWGGEHVKLEITAQGGEVEYDCGHGTIDQKIVPDGQGRFNLRGTHVREHGGPVRRDEIADSHPAQFSGQIKGDMMTLTVTESDTKELVGTFSLVFGQPPHLVKCR